MSGNRWVAAVAAALILPACGGNHSDHTEKLVFSDPDIETFPSEGRTHVPVGTVIAYGTDPPTSGNHYPDPQDGGFFDHEIAAGFLVHSMEHGAVIIYYNPATVAETDLNELRELAVAHPGSFSQIVCVPRNDPTYPIILTAWTHRLRLMAFDQDRIDNFITLFLGQGPEKEGM